MPTAIASPAELDVSAPRASGARRDKRASLSPVAEFAMPTPRASIRDRRGLTLIEILVVIIVIGLLAGLVAPQIIGRVSEARGATAQTQIELLSVALDNYRLDNGRYPTTAQGLNALRTKPSTAPVPANWRGPYLRKEVPVDPWNRPYVYVSPGEENPSSYDLFTLGADGVPGGQDEDADITSWQ